MLFGRLPVCCLALLAFSLASTIARTQISRAYSAQLPTPQVRVTGEIDNSQITALPGSTYPLAIPANDRGPVASDLPLRRMLLLLRRSPQQEEALDQLLAGQQNPHSPLYHQWLTPEQFGQWFGPADQDVQSVTAWLASEGFTGITVSHGRTVIEFSGTAGQVASAFHTSLHRYEINGTLHMANQSDPSIPSALSPVVAGIVSLNDLRRHSEVVRGPIVRQTRGKARSQVVSRANPQFTSSGGGFFAVAPYDFATIYDLLPLWNAGLDGTGETIALVGETDIHLSDPEQFRAFYGLPVNNPTVLIAGADPGFQPDEIESDLDVEWSGAVAKGANIELVSSASTNVTAGTDLSALYIVDNNLAPIMSESYGECELFMGTAANTFESAVFQQASAEGITVLVSSGDAGSADCDDGNEVAFNPMAVSGIASTPYDTAVGGTDFHDNNIWSQYWSGTNDPTTKESALGYIPEIPWNGSCGSTILDAYGQSTPSVECSGGGYLNTNSTGGGPSSCISSDGSTVASCTGGYPKPSWQSGPGVPSDNVRDVPDASFFASNAVYNQSYLICDEDLSGPPGCDPSASAQTFVGVGGTSASAPAMAGVMAIIDQKNGRQGNANPALYRLAAGADGASIFHNIAVDGNRVACKYPNPDCIVSSVPGTFWGYMKGHDSNAGYNTVTGLGSIDVANLVTDWGSFNYAPTSTTLELNGGTATVSAVHGTAIQAAVDVSAASGSPTGDVSLTGATANGSFYLGPLSSGAVIGSMDALPGGSYAVTAHYAGDEQFAPSDSSPVNVNITPEPSTTTLSFWSYDMATGTFVPVSSAPYGSVLMVRADVRGASGHGDATGAITLVDGSMNMGQFGLNAQGSTIYYPQTIIPGGVHPYQASYGGDSSFNSSSTSGTLTVTPAPTNCIVGPNTTTLLPNWSLKLNPLMGYTGSTITNMAAPTGTMTIYSGSTVIAGPVAVTGEPGTYTILDGEVLIVGASASIPPVTLPASQVASLTAPLTVVYSGDESYATCTSAPFPIVYQTGLMTPQAGLGLAQPNTDTVTQGDSLALIAQLAPNVFPPNGEPYYPAPTGTLQLVVDGSNVGSPVPLTAGTQVADSQLNGYCPCGIATLNVQTTNLSLGSHNANYAYSGDSNYTAATSGTLGFIVGLDDFSISAPSPLTVASGQSTQVAAIDVTNLGTFTGIVSFSCSGLPTGAACSFSPSTVDGGGSTLMTISTVQASVIGAGTVAHRNGTDPPWMPTSTGITCSAFLVVLLLPRRGKRKLFLILVFSAVASEGLTSCGGGSPGSSTTQGAQYVTSTTVTGASASPAKGVSDTFTAQVTPVTSGAPSPTGNVQFSVDGNPSGSPVTLSNSEAQFTTSFSTAGSHTVTAAYSGDGSDEPSNSGAFALNVPYTNGTLPGTYTVTVTGTSGSLSHSTTLTLVVQNP